MASKADYVFELTAGDQGSKPIAQTYKITRDGHQGRDKNVSVTIFFLTVLCLMQVAWNVHLSGQLQQVKDTVSFLLENCRQQSDNSADLEPQGDRASKLSDEDNFLRLLSIKRQRAESERLGLAMQSTAAPTLEATQPAKVPHSIVRRSPEEEPKSRKVRASKRRKSQTSLRRRRRHFTDDEDYVDTIDERRSKKAIAIHVQALNEETTSPAPMFDTSGNSTNFKKGKVGGAVLTGWQTPTDTTFGTRKLRQYGYVTVPKPGMYFVYSQVVFETSTLPYMVAEIGVKTMGSQIFSKCMFSRPADNTRNGSFVTCTSTGVVRLGRSEGISLSVNPPNVKVYMKPACTYFGAFYIGK